MICKRVDCPNINSSYIELNFISNDEDIIFGPTSLVQIEDVIINSDTETDIPFSTFENQIGLDLENNKSYTIIIGVIDTIQIDGMLELVYIDECCDIFELRNVRVNGITTCLSNCTTINIDVG